MQHPPVKLGFEVIITAVNLFAASLPPLLLRLLPGGANQFPDGISLPLRASVFFTAHWRGRFD